MGKTKDKTKREKENIVRVHNFFEEQKDRILTKSTMEERKIFLKTEVDFRSPSNITASLFEVGERSVRRYVDEKKQMGSISSPKKHLTGRKRIIIDSFTEGVIRRKILEAYAQKQYLTVSRLRQELSNDPNFPAMSRVTLYRIMKKQLKFKFMKFHCKPVPFERQDITAARHTYLRKIRLYRSQGYKVYYQDESWVNESQAPTQGWHIPEKEVIGMGDNGTHVDVWLKGVGRRFTENLMGGVTGKPSGAGRRVILLGIGSNDGFLHGPTKAFIGVKNAKSQDYHSEMNGAHFNEWFEQVLNLIPSKSVIVLDQASYHKLIVPSTKNPTTQWRKKDLIDWMTTRNVPLPEEYSCYEEMTVAVLRALSEKYKTPQKFIVDELIEKSQKDIKLLWLPVAHCELNPIELIWSWVKREVATKNTTFKIKDVHNLAQNALSETSANLWQKCVDHVLKLEQLFMDKEYVFDEFLTTIPNSSRIIIPLSEQDSSDDDEDSDTETEDDNEDESGDNYGILHEELLDV